MRISEQAVFRWVVIVGIGAASVIALTLLTRPLAGGIWGLLLICAGVAHSYRWLKRRGASADLKHSQGEGDRDGSR